MKKTDNRAYIKRIATDGVLTALCFALSLVTIPIGDIRLSLASTAVVVCALLYGPGDALIVAGLGEFLSQLLKYGITVTTPLWILPPMVRGLIIGIAAAFALRKGKELDRTGPGVGSLFKKNPDGSTGTADITLRIPLIYYAVSLFAAFATTLANSAVMYLDSKIFGYYFEGYIMLQFALRIITGLITSLIVTSVSIPLLAALRRAGFGKKPGSQGL